MRHEYHNENPTQRQRARGDPRGNQKARTRKAVLEAASELLRKGMTPTVADAAESAKVSRATAYRYFPTQDQLLLELGRLMPAMKPVDEMIRALPADVPERLSLLLTTFNSAVLDQEAVMRTMLRAGLDTWLENYNQGVDVPVREGRRIGWLDQVLEPIRKELSAANYRRLRAALALTLGPDSIFIMKDVCGLDGAEALTVLEWAARALLQAGSNEAVSVSARKEVRGGRT